MVKRPVARLRDVAQLAQVAESTVSKVLAGKATVSEETRTAIFAAAESLGYRQMKKTMAIGILAAGENPLEGIVPFLSDVFHGIEQVCRAQEVGLMFSSVFQPDITTLGQMPIVVQRHQIEGAILINLYDPHIFTLLEQAGIPFVCICHHMDLPRADTVVCDDEKGGYLATRYLIEHGHRSPPPAFIGSTAAKSSLYQRYLGYRRALAEANIPCDERYVWLGEPSDPKGMRRIPDIRGREGVLHLFGLPVPPTAIFCCTDWSANAAVDQLHALQIAVPEQCSLVGFDDSPIVTRNTLPLTTIQSPNEALGAEAARLLLSRLEYPQLPGRRVCLDVTLIERGSVATREA